MGKKKCLRKKDLTRLDAFAFVVLADVVVFFVGVVYVLSPRVPREKFWRSV